MLALTQNEPCPVCGSLEHPNKAQYSGDVVTKVQVEQARQQQQDWVQRQQEAFHAWQQQGFKTEQIAQNLTTLSSELTLQQVALLNELIEQQQILHSDIAALQQLNPDLLKRQIEEGSSG